MFHKIFLKKIVVPKFFLRREGKKYSAKSLVYARPITPVFMQRKNSKRPGAEVKPSKT